MKLRFHERHQQPRATDVFHQPEQNEWETFEAGHIIRQVIQVAQEKLGGMEKVPVTKESAVLVFASRPDLIPAIFPHQTETKERKYITSRFDTDKILNTAMMQKIFAGERGVPGVDISQVEAELPLVLESLGISDDRGNLIKWGVILALFMPYKKPELKSAVKRAEDAWLKRIDLPDLNPNVYPACAGAFLRLLDPSTTAPLREILSRRARGWIEQIEESLSPEQTSKYSKRGLNFYLPWALQESLGLEILLADEALIDDNGNFVITHHTKPLGASTPLPVRPLN